jgi:hypothetical protein
VAVPVACVVFIGFCCGVPPAVPVMAAAWILVLVAAAGATLQIIWSLTTGRTHQMFSSLCAPAKDSAKKSGFSAATLRLRAMLSLSGFCFSRHSAIFLSTAKFAAP